MARLSFDLSSISISIIPDWDNGQEVNYNFILFLTVLFFILYNTEMWKQLESEGI